MNFSTIRAALKTAATSCSALTHAGAVEWKGAKQSAGFRKFPRVDLSLRSIQGVGNDEVRKEYDADTDALLLNVCGNRTMVWTIRVETDDGSDSGIAAGIGMRLMARLQRPAVLADLRAAGLAVADFQPLQTIDSVKLQDRVLSVAVLDVFLNAAENDADDVSSGDYIQSVEVETDTLDNEAGVPVDNQINLIVEAP